MEEKNMKEKIDILFNEKINEEIKPVKKKRIKI